MKYYIPVFVFLFIYISYVPGQNAAGDSYVLVHGGSWSGGAGFCRSTYRGSVSPSSGGVILGLRLIRSH